MEVEDTEPEISRDLLRRAHHALQDSTINEGLTVEVMRQRTHGHESLTQHLDELRMPPPEHEKAQTDASECEERQRIAEAEAEERQRRADWDAQLRANQTELRENRFSPPNLHTLANVYFDEVRGGDRHASPSRRIRDFVGGDPHLADLVLVALREAVRRDDVPHAEETIALRAESKQPWLAFPVLASLSLHEHDPAKLDDLADAQKRNALAFYYSLQARTRVHSGYRSASRCYDRWLDQSPELVLDTLYRCVVSAIRSGEEHPPGLADLDLIDDHDDAVHSLRLRLLRDAIKMLARWCRPTEQRGYQTRVTSASEQVHGSINALSSQTDAKAVRALTELTDDPSLEQWRDRLVWARQHQNAALRDRSYVHPNVEQVLNTLRDSLPANAGDLTALLSDRLADISRDLRGGNSNIWHQFWNVDKHGRPTEPRPENTCRDALLETLRHRLPGGVDLQPEAQYAAGTQADLRFSFGNFKVPIEIKKNSHDELWSALHKQLIEKYTTDPDSSGHGI